MKNQPPPLYVWTLDAERYSRRIVSLTEAGLRDRVSAVLRASRPFERDPQQTILGVTDNFDGHVQRAFDCRRRVNLSALGPWRLFEFRSLVAPSDGHSFVDLPTRAAFDTICAFYLRNTILNYDTLAHDRWPGLAEWFLETDWPWPNVFPCMHGAVTSYLRRQLSFLPQLAFDDFALHVLGPDGVPLNVIGPGCGFGTFLVQIRERAEQAPDGQL